jgi:hypothetical protein
MVVSDFYLNPVLKDIGLRELGKERENLLEAVLLVLTLKCFLALLSKKDKNRFLD